LNKQIKGGTKKVELKKYMEEKTNYAMSNRILRFFVIVIGIAIIVQSFVMYSLWKSQRTVLVPPNITSQAFISGTDASDEYLRAMARYVMILTTTYSPSTARSQFSDFLKLVVPERFAEYKKVFYDLADKSETGNVSSSFFVSLVKVDRVKKELIVQGILNQWTQDKKFITDEVKSYLIAYDIRDGMFYVREIKLYRE
jgi:conjugal transfer pilus assembly protein TraE